MFVLDANVLIALFRADHPHHHAATKWFGNEVGARRLWCPDLCWVAFARIVTNRRIFPVPATFAEAWEFAVAMHDHPGYRAMPDSRQVLDQFATVGRDASATANLVNDAYVAGAALAYGAQVATFDRDFRHFDGLSVVEIPLD